MRHVSTYTGHTGAVYALAPGTRQGLFLSGAGDGRVVEWDASRPDEGLVRVTTERPVFALFAISTELLLVGGDSGRLHVIDLIGGAETRSFEVHTRGIFRIVRTAHGTLVCAGGDGSLSVWRTTGPALGIEMIRQVPLSDAKLRDLALAPDGRTLAVACADGRVHVLETGSFNELHTIEAHEQGATSVAYHPGKPVLMSGGKDGHLRAWHVEQDYRAVHGFPAHGGNIYAIGFGPDGERMATAGRDKVVKVWDARSLAPMAALDRTGAGPARSVNTLLWTGDRLLSAGDDRTVHAWA